MPFRIARPTSLVDIVDAIWDLDVPDSGAAMTFTMKQPPGPNLLLIAQYRLPLRATWRFGYEAHEHGEFPYCAIQVQRGSVSLRPAGPLGLITVCLKPEAAVRLITAPLQEFANTKITLRDVFNIGEVSLLEEMLAEAHDSRERIATVEAFLLHHVHRLRPLSIACRAASLLRHDPALAGGRLASKLDISQRHLERTFRATFGVNPKQFARLSRFEAVMTARRQGGTWADLACACGFADQAHMIREFNRIVGQSPEDFFQLDSGMKLHPLNANCCVLAAKID
jgi:AraC-like DNA-binding protein